MARSWRSRPSSPTTGRSIQGEVLLEAGAPDDVGDLEDAPVLEQRLPAAHADDTGHPLDAGRGEVLRLHPDQRGGAEGELRPDLAADRRSHREHAVAHEADDWEREACANAPVGDGNLADLSAREPRRAAMGELGGDLGAGVAGAHDERCAVAQLRRIAVLAGVQLDDAGVQLGGEAGHPGRPVRAGCRDDAVGLEPPAVRRDDEPTADLAQSVDAHAPGRTVRPKRAAYASR